MFQPFFQWVDGLTQGPFWQSLFGRFLWVDWMTFLFGVVGFISGAIKGLVTEIGGLVALLVIITSVFFFQPQAQIFLAGLFPQIPLALLEPVGYILLAVASWGLVHLASKVLHKLVHTEVAAPLRITGGALVGTVRFLILWSFISQALLLMPLKSIRRAYGQGQSVTGYSISRLAPRLYQGIRAAFVLPQDKKTAPAGRAIQRPSSPSASLGTQEK